ncbi:MAG: AAA family ATPase [Pseudomonadota bacterium]|nr:AAA family ATPase [Pseudomonadota bacterium]
MAGFKSFVEPTELVIEEGLTGIVGPNGCGKSNLVEALRWAMGESSAKQMRGGEMDDVIFSGTSDRPARNIAEVILSMDNSDRRAPAQFNGTDELDIVRRIERGNGSNYKVNGLDARARDVQTLFADASTGARSTALVSQGNIGEIIHAKPTQRRLLIEEAAGITGLQSRRHEAELRLRGAENNLGRLEDIVAALEEQHKLLKRQARQASRYRNLSDHLKRHEAIILHLQWVATQLEQNSATERLQEIEKLVVERTQAVTSINTAQANASNVLPGLRNNEVKAAAALHRMLVLRDALAAESQRIEKLQIERKNRVQQLDGDIERENNLQIDANTAIDRLKEEQIETQEKRTRETQALDSARTQLKIAEEKIEERENELAQLTHSVVSDETRRTALQRQLAQFEAHHQRLNARKENISAERTELEDKTESEATLTKTRRLADEARANAQKERENLRLSEAQTLTAREAENKARERYQLEESKAAKLRAENEALLQLLETGDPQLWPPMIDAVEVNPGYEVALGAALGEDLTAPTDEASPIHWRVLPLYSNPCDLPENILPLSRFVRGPAALMRRISQIGVVETDDIGNQLHPSLEQGQRLVSISGALWRWDGYTAAAGAPTTAATRLAHRNRVEEMRDDLQTSIENAQAAKSTQEVATMAVVKSAEKERKAREALWTADRIALEKRDAATTVAENSAKTQSRLSALNETITSIEADLTEGTDQQGKIKIEYDNLTDVVSRRLQLQQKQSELTKDRVVLAQRRSAHDRLDQEAHNRHLRLRVIEKELEAWKKRSSTAILQIGQLSGRREQESDALKKLGSRPSEIAEEEQALIERIGAAEIDRKDAANKLIVAEDLLKQLTHSLRNAETILAQTREERVRFEADVEQTEEKLSALSKRISERLECSPSEVLARVGIDSDTELPTQDTAQNKLERLQRERDTMGPVNLRADQEMAELSKKINELEAERVDLISAIAQLRQGISGLNREGRERLLVAFNEVDQHFRDLFAKLFGGGRAHLRLTEGEDPLEAGLEVFASPPGKRLQSMTLLSGGEQALTALALLFAVFMTNPAPICVLDEVDAPLDDSNVDRFCSLLEEISIASNTRFMLVTHHRLTMARMDRLYGVTMADRGISQLVSVDLRGAEELRETA